MIKKAATNITGFDELTGGGLPRGPAVLIWAVSWLVWVLSDCIELEVIDLFEQPFRALDDDAHPVAGFL